LKKPLPRRERGEGKESEVGKESEGCCIGDTP
jgi:hypothetical protein